MGVAKSAKLTASHTQLFNTATNNMEEKSLTTATKPRMFRGKMRSPKWIYGQESAYFLTAMRGGQGLGFHYSHDVKNKFRPINGKGNERSDAAKIQALQGLFQKGGTRRIPMSPQTADVAYIVKNRQQGGKWTFEDIVLAWNASEGWHQPRKKAAKAPAAFKLWMKPLTAAKAKTISVHPSSPDFQAYCGTFAAAKPHLCERYADAETGEIDPNFLLCSYLGLQAALNRDGYNIGYIYGPKNNTPLLRVDLQTGIVCGIGEGGGWVSPAFFHNLNFG